MTNQDDRFKPPTAAVADIHSDRTFSRSPVIALACAGLVAIVWLMWRMPGYLRLVSVNAMNPSIMFLALAGMLCFVVGLVRAFLRGLRGRKSFVAAIVLMLLPLLRLEVLAYPVYAQAFAPFILAAIVAAVGFFLVLGRVRQTRAQP